MATSRATLEAKPRALSGKQCRFLRRAGITPANLYGAAMESLPLQVDTKTLVGTIVHTSRNAPIDLRVAGATAPTLAFIWRVQRHPLTEEIMHVDFYHVEATRRMRAEVPVILDGVNQGLAKLDRRLPQFLLTVTVETLPADLPTEIHADASKLLELGDSIRVKDLLVSAKVTLMTPPENVVARVMAIIEVVEETPAAAVTEVVPGAEGATAEGEAPAAEGADEKKPGDAKKAPEAKKPDDKKAPDKK